MIIKDLKTECLGQYDNVKIYINKAFNKFISGEIAEVITDIAFTDLENNIIYKYNCYNGYICRVEDNTNKYFNLNDIIHDLALFVGQSTMEKYFKDNIITSVLNNEFSGLNAIKLFKKDYYKKVEENIRIEKAEKCRKEIEIIKEDINKIIEEIKATSKEQIRIKTPNKYNHYCYELFTKSTYKKFETLLIYDSEEGVKEYRNILKFFNDYLHYISVGIEPKNYMKFDKVI